MICPLKFNSMTLNANGVRKENACKCEEEECAWWNPYYGKCAAVVDAYLKGIAQEKRDMAYWITRREEED